MADKPTQIKKPKKKDKGLKTADSVNYPTNFELSSIGEKGSLPLKKYKTKSKIKDKDDDKRYRVENSEMHDKASKKVKRQKKLDKSLDKQGYKPTLETRAKTRVSAFDNANRIRGGLKKGGRAGYSVGGKAIRGVSKILLKK